MKRSLIKFTTFSFLFISLIYLACKKANLDIPPPTQSEATYFTSESEYRTAIIGVYAGLVDFYGAANATGFGSAELQVWTLPGDDLTHNGSDAFETFGGLNPSNGKLNEFFKSSYFLLGRANKILEKLNNVPQGVFVTPNMEAYIRGEALFLRGFTHFKLWNVFATAPVDTIVPKSTSDFNLPSSSGTDLLDQAVKDLTQAASLLPATWTGNELGRVTMNSANGMLGKVLVFRATVKKDNADYQAAIAAFNKITGASLVPNFGNNFLTTTENNAESLFEFQAGPNIINQGQNVWLGNTVCDCGVTGSYFQMFYDDAGTYMGGGRYLPSQKLKDALPVGDPRRPLTINAAGTHVLKYVVNGDVKDGAVASLNNYRILRLADVLLLKAEALVQSGGSTSEAIGLINDIRTRARNMGGGAIPANFSTAETNRATILQWVMDERLRELAAEGHRWFDLRRWHIGQVITLNNAYFSSEVPARMAFQPHHVNFPIPDSETNVNPNIIQNSGY